MQTDSRGPNPFVVVITTAALLPGIAVLLYYALDPGLRAGMGWHAAWLFAWCGVCVLILGYAVKRRYANLRRPPHGAPSRTKPADVPGPVSPF